MTATPNDLTEIRTLETLAAEPPGHLERDLDELEPELEAWEQEPPLPPLRVGLVVACTVIGAAVMAGSVFDGIVPRVSGAAAGLVGVAVAAQASRRKSALMANLTIVLGITGAGIVLVIPAGIDNLTRLVSILSEAKGAAHVLRPPAEFLPGWRLIFGWIMACIGFAAGWVGIEFRRPALGLMIPLPVIAMGAISVPDEAKLPAGIVAVVLFIVGLTLLSSTRDITSDGEGAPDAAYELRRALKAAPVLAVIAAVLVVMARSEVLFPKPAYDPTRNAQRPRAVPLSKVKDRPLFTVHSPGATGPWRLGILDVYDGGEWRLPPFDESKLARVPSDGVVDGGLEPGLRADFVVKDLGGAVLPGLPNTVAIVAEGPRLAYDPRTGNIRLAQGQIHAGLQYSVTAAANPTAEDLQKLGSEQPAALHKFTVMPDPPAAVGSLLSEAPNTNLWDRLDFVRRRLLETVVASGPGTPKPVSPGKVADMLTGSKEGSPFEIVAGQAMLARWAGVPARIAYGFDGGDVIGEDTREVHPKHGASWLEVYFPTHGWLPIVGSPLKARTSLNDEGPTLPSENVEASDDIAVQVFVPLRRSAGNQFYQRAQKLVIELIPIALLSLLVYVTWPALRKARRRGRQRRWAEALGARARVALAYAEFRDTATDLGLESGLTPIAFCGRFAQDDEHTELAWLVTRVLWGDLRHDIRLEHALDAETLARSLRRRLLQAQPLSMRVIAAVSRLSVRHPHAPELAAPHRRVRRQLEAAAPHRAGSTARVTAAHPPAPGTPEGGGGSGSDPGADDQEGAHRAATPVG